jgi:hypothetical protein
MLRPIRRESGTELPPALPRIIHPHEVQLERFMRSELSPAEVAQVIRHLLIGCTRCQSVTRRLWALGERVPSGAESGL